MLCYECAFQRLCIWTYRFLKLFDWLRVMTIVFVCLTLQVLFFCLYNCRSSNQCKSHESIVQKLTNSTIASSACNNARGCGAVLRSLNFKSSPCHPHSMLVVMKRSLIMRDQASSHSGSAVLSSLYPHGSRCLSVKPAC